MDSGRWIFGIASAVLVASLFAPAGASAAPGEKAASEEAVVATVGGKEITLKDLDRFIERLPERVRNFARNQKGEMLESLIHRRLMFRHAEAQQLGESERVKSEFERARREIMIREAVRVVEEGAKPTPEEMKVKYENDKGEYREGDKVTASHIMVASEKEAQELLVKLKGGTDFAELAKKYSLAPERAKGGSLGTMERGHHKLTGLPEIIEQTAFSLEPGAYSGVVKSVYGWHVVYASKKHEGRQLTFAEARPSIEKSMGEEKRRGALRKVLEELAKRYQVKKFPERLR